MSSERLRSVLGAFLGFFFTFLIPALGAARAVAQSVRVEAGIAVEILDESGSPPSAVPLDAVALSLGGEGQAVTGLERLGSGEWRILIWSDPEVVPAEQLGGAVRLLQAESAVLSDLGSVELRVARSDVQIWLEPETDAEEIEAALEELATTGFGEPRGASKWRHQLLLSEVAALFVEGPKALVLVGGLGSESGENAEWLGASLAALGWTVVAVEIDGSEDGAAARLVTASGGRLVGSAAELSESLRDLSGRFWLRFDRDPTLPPLVLDVRSSRVGVSVSGPRWGPGLTEAVAGARAERYLRLGEAGQAELKTALEMVSEDEPSHAELKAEVMVDLGTLSFGGRRSSDLLRASLLLVSAEAEGQLLHYRGRGADLRNSSRWLLEAALAVPPDLQEIVVVVENLASGEFGAAAVDADRQSLGILGANTRVETVDLRPPKPVTAVAASRAPEEEKLIRLLPLMSRQATGKQTFKTLLLNEAIRRTEFYLDGEKVAEDGRAPFSARVDLGPTVRSHTLEIVAFDRLGRELGRDSVSVNGEVTDFLVEIRSAIPASGAAGSLDVEVSVTVPAEARLERVDLYWNNTLRAVLETAPFEARVQTEASASGVDFLRAVATLADGRSLEDVELFGVGSVEEVEVNLVEVFTVVTQRDGTPVRDLDRSDFEMTLRGRPVEIERFGLAEKLPLALGLVVDTSGSMENIIQETKAAALQFLTELVSPRDQAFIVDFDTRPRLATGMTQDIRELFRALATLEPEGATAIYDAIVFSAIQFARGQDRRALVLLTDGDDYKSRFEHGRAIKQARAGAIPVYMISLAGMDWLRPTVRRDDLELIAKQTGGRVFYVESRDQLAPAYAKIGAELRSQYVLAFSSDSALSDKDLERIEVKVKRRGLDVRAVVAGHSVQ